MKNLFNEGRFGGVRIVESATVPAVARFKVPAGSLLSSATRARLDAWLRARHGDHYPPLVIAGTMYVHPGHADELRATIAAINQAVADQAAIRAAVAAAMKTKGGDDGPD
jgi:hypothetical protein